MGHFKNDYLFQSLQPGFMLGTSLSSEPLDQPQERALGLLWSIPAGLPGPLCVAFQLPYVHSCIEMS